MEIDELPDRIAHRARCCEINNPREFAADDPTRAVRIRGARYSIKNADHPSAATAPATSGRRGVGN